VKKILHILSLYTSGILPLHAHTEYPSFTTWDIILMFALWFGMPVVVIGSIVYFIVKNKHDIALRLTLFFIILGIFYYLFIGF